MDLNVLRRITERGLKAAQKQKNSEMIDCWQHLLDELEIIMIAKFIELTS